MVAQHLVRKIGAVLILGLLIVYTTSKFRSSHGTSSKSNDPDGSNAWPGPQPIQDVDHAMPISPCQLFPDHGTIAVSVKTGATEAMKKLPAMLNTSLACINDLMVFSDLEQKLGDLQIHDVLAKFSKEVMKGNPEFEIYQKQKDLIAEHRDHELETLSGMLAPERGWETDGKSASWSLDKYKFLHMIEMAWELQPDREWYIFIEADTYLSWTNLNRWLAGLPKNSSQTDLYFGNALRKSLRPPKYFAHGGSGFVLSGAAMRNFAIDHKGLAAAVDDRIYKWWAGDMLLADELAIHLGLEITDAAPMFHHFDSAMFEPSAGMWATPAITVHHIDPSEFQEIHDRENALGFDALLLRDVYAVAAAAKQSLETAKSRQSGTRTRWTHGAG